MTALLAVVIACAVGVAVSSALTIRYSRQARHYSQIAASGFEQARRDFEHAADLSRQAARNWEAITARQAQRGSR